MKSAYILYPSALWRSLTISDVGDPVAWARAVRPNRAALCYNLCVVGLVCSGSLRCTHRRYVHSLGTWHALRHVLFLPNRRADTTSLTQLWQAFVELQLIFISPSRKDFFCCHQRQRGAGGGAVQLTDQDPHVLNMFWLLGGPPLLGGPDKLFHRDSNLLSAVLASARTKYVNLAEFLCVWWHVTSLLTKALTSLQTSCYVQWFGTEARLCPANGSSYHSSDTAGNIGVRAGQLWVGKSPNCNSDSAREASQRPRAHCDVISSTFRWYQLQRIACCAGSMKLHTAPFCGNY